MIHQPRTINPARTFQALVDWFYEEMIVKQKAPGFLVGLSGTDSLVAFLAAAKAFEKAGKPNRVMGVHFAPSEDFLDDHPEAEVHTWFANQVVPWLKEQAPGAQVVVDTSIDWRCDGLRWGYLMDLSVVSNDHRRMMRLPDEQYWVVGTRNKTEDALMNYSNASMAASIQPIIHLWKSEILQLSEYLGAPKIAMEKSCETDCICGRLRLPSLHIKEVDWLLMSTGGDLSTRYVDEKIPKDLRLQLSKFILAQISQGAFKASIPYKATLWTVDQSDPLVLSFEDGSLNIKEFNHRKHIYVAWYYLTHLPFQVALDRYCRYLKVLLDKNGQSHRFSLPITQAYFKLLFEAMSANPTDNFDELMVRWASQFQSLKEKLSPAKPVHNVI